MRWLSLLVLGLCVAGCGGGAAGAGKAPSGRVQAARAGVGQADLLRIGDLVKISFSGSPNSPIEQEERIKDDGKINLQYLGVIQAEGKTPGDLQREIQSAYVPKLYRRLTVTVKSENRFFYVDGEVRSPGRLVYAEEITVLRVVAAAGGFTDFAARTRVELVRATGEKVVIDARKAKDNPTLDPIVLPGDRIFVPRKSAFGK